MIVIYLKTSRKIKIHHKCVDSTSLFEFLIQMHVYVTITQWFYYGMIRGICVTTVVFKN